MAKQDRRKRITIAIVALGGQGGGVLAQWISALGSRHGYVSQATSVPGVAQRTGSTVYYIEMLPAAGGEEMDVEPVMALMPVAGDVDIVIASELMEAGRAILRGFVSANRTTLIGSTHRIYAIAEKSAVGDGRTRSDKIIEAANRRAKRFIGFDMDELADRTGSVISSVMFGALAGSDALPFPRDSFEEVIRESGKAVAANLAGFAAGLEAAISPRRNVVAMAEAAPSPATASGLSLMQRIRAELPEAAHRFTTEGVRRLLDYQDERYAELYLERLAKVRAKDTGLDDWRITRETARYLALWMSYEDTIRVADLKIRRSRFDRVREEVRVEPGELLHVTEFMHPRVEEICDTLPSGIGKWILGSRRISSFLQRRLSRGRLVKTTSLGWFLLLCLLASLRRWRRGTLRYAVEQDHIEGWLELVRAAADHDPIAAAEIVECQRLIKGYGETFSRGLANYNHIVEIYRHVRHRPEAGMIIRELREVALRDDGSTDSMLLSQKAVFEPSSRTKAR